VLFKNVSSNNIHRKIYLQKMASNRFVAKEPLAPFLPEYREMSTAERPGKNILMSRLKSQDGDTSA
jgi:hypothetical protein